MGFDSRTSSFRRTPATWLMQTGDLAVYARITQNPGLRAEAKAGNEDSAIKAALLDVSVQVGPLLCSLIYTIHLQKTSTPENARPRVLIGGLCTFGAIRAVWHWIRRHLTRATSCDEGGNSSCDNTRGQVSAPEATLNCKFVVWIVGKQSMRLCNRVHCCNLPHEGTTASQRVIATLPLLRLGPAAPRARPLCESKACKRYSLASGR